MKRSQRLEELTAQLAGRVRRDETMRGDHVCCISDFRWLDVTVKSLTDLAHTQI